MHSATPPDATHPGSLIQRRAAPSDLPRMWEIRTAAIRLTWATHYEAQLIETIAASPPPPSMASLIESGGAFLAADGGTILGYAVLDIHTGEIDAVFVDPPWQGRGIARRLLLTVEKTAAESGLGRLFLSSALNAVGFYESVGFLTVRQEMSPHRSGIDIPAVVMEKYLAPRAPQM